MSATVVATVRRVDSPAIRGVRDSRGPGLGPDEWVELRDLYAHIGCLTAGQRRRLGGLLEQVRACARLRQRDDHERFSNE
jgi:hypothetical protein